MNNHYLSLPYLPVILAAPAINLLTGSGAPADGETPNIATATLIDLLTGQHIANVQVYFTVSGDALFDNDLQAISATTDDNGVATVAFTNTRVETVTLVATYSTARQQAYASFVMAPAPYQLTLELLNPSALADFADIVYVQVTMLIDGQPAPYGSISWLRFDEPTGASSHIGITPDENGRRVYPMRQYIPGRYLVEGAWEVDADTTIYSNIVEPVFLARPPLQPYRIDFSRQDQVELPNVRTTYLTMTLRNSQTNAVVPNQTLEMTTIDPQAYFATLPVGPDGTATYVFPPSFIRYASFKVTWLQNPSIFAIYFLWTYDIQP